MEVEKANMGFEEPELRLGLGLPGNNSGGGGNEGEMTIRKRGFSQTVDLELNISSKEESAAFDPNQKTKNLPREKNLLAADPAKPPAKAQVVGWPPVRSYRKNMLAVPKSSNIKNNSSEESSENNSKLSNSNGSFVKVSMDGAPYLRKVDLNMYNGYYQLSHALAQMFSTIGNCGSQGMKDFFLNESKLIDLLNGTDYVPTYEDKDGDWMLVGDVPWEMFVESCKRLRLMKGTEATGIAPRAMEKRKNTAKV
ncbi:hypothetical protein JCGZ_21840 [Jatropha curcas]|uniref:Auxin-responsive protein n=1 Tax=Jatropha curcas TaxID=180498 RepID=A0A067JPA6_JATCU|nr:auxin-induced protein AUX28 [Jatropha curcas]KDP21369.1 hypothetical protein JCGZ_21840 [Jatropha curcas]